MNNGVDPPASGNTDADRYFASNPRPVSINLKIGPAREFIADHANANRKVVLVTSGGTTVPLENQTVRFIDNFSAGTRGATSAEYFLEAGYAVIFLHRQFSLLPYSRHYSHSVNCFLDFMTENKNGDVMIDGAYQEKMQSVLRKYKAASENNRLLLLPFTSITEYLWSLRELALLMRPLGSTALFYLAAAVSDFFLPRDKLSEHKIQSSAETEVNPENYPTLSNGNSGRGQSNKLIINLDPVPKFLKDLVDGWAPEGMIVSFKLETDPSLLISKAQQALAKYSHHLVIGNLLSSRKYEVVFITAKGENWIRIPYHRRTASVTSPAFLRQKLMDVSDKSVAENESLIEIESLIIPEVTAMHENFMKATQEDHEVDEQNMLANALAWADSGAD